MRNQQNDSPIFTPLFRTLSFVWKTKYGYPILRGDIGLRVRELIRKICVEKAITVVRGNVRADHIHVLVSAPSHLSVSR
jgi:putative transposase